MAELSAERLSLFDKLYNLRSDKSVVTNRISRAIQQLETKLESVNKSKAAEEARKLQLEKSLDQFIAQTDLAIRSFSDFEDDSFKSLEEVGVSIQLKTLLTKLKEAAPKKENNYGKLIEDCIARINALGIEVSSLERELAENEEVLLNANVSKRKLDDLLTDIIDRKSEKYPREYIRETLSAIGEFDEEEISILCPLIMFPESGLSEYNDIAAERAVAYACSVITDEVEEEEVHEEVVPIIRVEDPNTGIFARTGTQTTVKKAAVEENSEISRANLDELYRQAIDVTNTYVNFVNPLDEQQKKEEAFITAFGTVKPVVEKKEEKKDNDTQSPITQVVNDESHETHKVTEIEETIDLKPLFAEAVKATQALIDSSYENEETDEIVVSQAPTVEDEDVATVEEIQQMFAEAVEATEKKINSAQNSIEVAVIQEQDVEQKKTDEAEVTVEQTSTEEENVELALEAKEEKDLISELGLDKEKLSQEAIDLINNTDIKVLQNNLSILKSMYLSDDIIYFHENGYMYLTDQNLVQKLTIIRGKGINDKIIEAQLKQHKLTMTLAELQERLEILASKSITLDETNINILNHDIVKYYESVNELASYGLELDDNEANIFSAALEKMPYVKEDLEVLKNYLITIERRNGKYALQIFWKSPSELTKTIDRLIEANQEDLLACSPEALYENTVNLINRIKYCQENNIPLKDEEHDVYYSYVTNAGVFAESFPEAVIGSVEQQETSLESISDNEFTKMMIEALDNYYTSNVEPVKLDETQTETYNSLLQTMISTYKLEQVSQNAYKLNDILISKVKVERNLSYLIDILNKQGQSIEGLEREIILLSMLHNTNVEEKVLSNIININVNFNQAVGGLAI